MNIASVEDTEKLQAGINKFFLAIENTLLSDDKLIAPMQKIKLKGSLDTKCRRTTSKQNLRKVLLCINVNVKQFWEHKDNATMVRKMTRVDEIFQSKRNSANGNTQIMHALFSIISVDCSLQGRKELTKDTMIVYYQNRANKAFKLLGMPQNTGNVLWSMQNWFLIIYTVKILEGLVLEWDGRKCKINPIINRCHGHSKRTVNICGTRSFNMLPASWYQILLEVWSLRVNGLLLPSARSTKLWWIHGPVGCQHINHSLVEQVITENSGSRPSCNTRHSKPIKGISQTVIPHHVLV